MKPKLSVALSSLALTASLPFATAHAVESVNPNDLGVVEAPNAGSTPVDLAAVPPLVLHAARVAFKEYDGQAVLTGAQTDADEIEAVYEVKGRASGAGDRDLAAQSAGERARGGEQVRCRLRGLRRVVGDREEHSSERRRPAGDFVRVQWRDL
ncbi:MAG: hypothetical protein USCGTAYLOR_02503 [Chromatiales bacterium USCg_Taylor]|nr:MAG: hypothetical protein USCGTAYLOR_02503 [Chromatiales bacterium USCg_Taylor]